MKRWKSLTAALCAAVLLCGFSVPAYAYADGGEGADYGDPTMTEETPAPEPTIEPGEGFSEEGNLVTCDLLYDEHTNKQFITVQTSGGNTFYIVIDYDKPVDEEGEQYETYFFSVVDEADLLAAAEAAGVEQAVCSCSEKCAAGAVNTDCAVCSVNISKCVGIEPEQLQQLRTALEQPAPRWEHIGIYNVAARLRLLDARCRVVVRSRPGRGTAVILYLPLVENEEEFEE